MRGMKMGPEKRTGTQSRRGTHVANSGSAELQWGSGGITQIGDGASNAGDLYVDGANALAEVGNAGSDNVVSGLTTIANNGTLDLRDGTVVSLANLATDAGLLNFENNETVTIGSSLNLAPSGRIKVDTYDNASGGSQITITGNLTNGTYNSFGDGGISVGNSNLKTASRLSVTGTLNNIGLVVLIGTSNAAATLAVGGGVSTSGECRSDDPDRHRQLCQPRYHHDLRQRCAADGERLDLAFEHHRLGYGQVRESTRYSRSDRLEQHLCPVHGGLGIGREHLDEAGSRRAVAGPLAGLAGYHHHELPGAAGCRLDGILYSAWMSVSATGTETAQVVLRRSMSAPAAAVGRPVRLLGQRPSRRALVPQRGRSAK